MVGRELGKDAVELRDAHGGQHLVDLSEAALLDGQQPSVFVLQIGDIVDHRHEQIQLRPAPEVVGLMGAGGVLDDRVCHGLHQLRFGVQTVKAVPAVAVLHVKEVDRLDVVAVFPKVRRKLFKQLALRVRDNDGLLPLRDTHEERDDKAAGLAAAGRANAQQIVVVPRSHAVRYIQGVLVRVVRVALCLSKQHARHVPHRAQLQESTHFLLRQEAGGAVGRVRQDIEAAAVVGVLVAGETAVPFFHDEAGQKDNHQRCDKSKRREDCQ